MSVLIRPHRFALDAALVDWRAFARPRSDLSAVLERIKRSEQSGATLQLRWAPHKSLGLPSGPFKVWVLEDLTQFKPEPLTLSTYFLPDGTKAVMWNRSMVWVALSLTATAGSAAFGVYGAPVLGNINSFAAVPAGGPETVILSGSSAISGVILAGDVTVNQAAGVPITIGEGPGWKLIETAGLPVDYPSWVGSGWDVPQGLVGTPLSPAQAAVSRLTRGAPPFGWASEVRPGTPAPSWSAPGFPALVSELNDDLLRRVVQLMAVAPHDQQTFEVEEAIPPPGAMTDASTARYSPLGALLLSAMTDPFPNLALGFGTAYDVGNANFDIAGGARTYAAAMVAVSTVPWYQRTIFRVTGEWAKGLDGRSASVEYGAVVVPAAGVIPPPMPAAFEALPSGIQSPPSPDAPWRADFRLRWERLVRQGLIRPASFAAARRRTAPPSSTTDSLGGTRRSGGPRPIAISTPPPTDPEPTRTHYTDQDLDIPNDPGITSVTYGVALQNLFGVWGPWASADASATQPTLDPVRVTRLSLNPVAPASGSGPCPATLVVDFVLDWRVRPPSNVRFVGRLYGADTTDQPPPSPVPPGDLPRSVGGVGTAIDVAFSGDTPTAPAFVGPGGTPPASGAYLQALATDPATQEDAFVTAGPPAQPTDMRRYRLTVPGFSLNFAPKPHINLALWANMTERIAPHRVSPWPSEPILTAASDPRPPPLVLVADPLVNIASLPDGAGQAHFRLSWPATAGATGYVVYQSTETKILAETGQDQPDLRATMSERLAAVRAAYSGSPTRRAFTRYNAGQLTGTSIDLALPRGTADIHLFTVLGVSSGQVESPWPTSPDAIIPVAAPRIATPPPPTLLVRADTTAGTASITIEGRGGDPAIDRFELFRVRNVSAAADLDTMGPPRILLSRATGDPDWSVGPATDPLGWAKGTDRPDGSWIPVWYRAVAWAKGNLAQAVRGTRSKSSAPVSVLVPPAGPPDLSALSVSQPALDPAEVLIQWTSSAPAKPTLLGSHVLYVRAVAPGRPAADRELLVQESALEVLAVTEPATPQRLWRTPASPSQYQLRIKRLDAADPVDVMVRLTDPLGRSSERVVHIEPGSVEPAPDISALSFSVPGGAFSEISFTSHSPTVPRPFGSYQLHLEVQTAKGCLGFFLPASPLTLDIALPDIAEAAGPPAASTTAITITREAPLAGVTVYRARAPGKVTHVSARISAPDGRVANAEA